MSNPMMQSSMVSTTITGNYTPLFRSTEGGVRGPEPPWVHLGKGETAGLSLGGEALPPAANFGRGGNGRKGARRAVFRSPSFGDEDEEKMPIGESGRGAGGPMPVAVQGGGHGLTQTRPAMSKPDWQQSGMRVFGGTGKGKKKNPQKNPGGRPRGLSAGGSHPEGAPVEGRKLKNHAWGPKRILNLPGGSRPRVGGKSPPEPKGSGAPTRFLGGPQIQTLPAEQKSRRYPGRTRKTGGRSKHRHPREGERVPRWFAAEQPKRGTPKRKKALASPGPEEAIGSASSVNPPAPKVGQAARRFAGGRSQGHGGPGRRWRSPRRGEDKVGAGGKREEGRAPRCRPPWLRQGNLCGPLPGGPNSPASTGWLGPHQPPRPEGRKGQRGGEGGPTSSPPSGPRRHRPKRPLGAGWGGGRGPKRGGKGPPKSGPKKAMRDAAAAAKGAPRKLRAPRSSAVVITLTAEAAERGVGYAEVLTKVKANVDLKALEIPGVRCKNTRTGARLLEAPLNAPEVRITGLDDSVTADELRLAVAETGSCPLDSVKAGAIRFGPGGQGAAVVSCPIAASERVADGRSLLVGGFLRAQARLLQARPARCFRCLSVGHVGVHCTAEATVGDRCFRCGQPGHKAGGCNAPLRCFRCAAGGKPADHRVGGKACALSRPKPGGRPSASEPLIQTESAAGQPQSSLRDAGMEVQ
ncbi:unnamed protein product [Arctia plantaginis]|uniref:CCHC-type domain-containing protein n=1 Tax=Arctia plantaginis TaxID=874455 RepID=A0A8S0YM84_ARCPL|nr:unnamed protein product [Arctia plantaginis]